MLRPVFPLLLALATAGGCASCEDASSAGEGPLAGGGGQDCIDGDGDGYGPGCAAGFDCDDGEPSQHPGAEELCDGIDQDCDGFADQALAGCATCRFDCGDGLVPPGAFAPDPTNSDGVGETPEGYLVLDRQEVSAAFAWIANADEGTVSKIDTSTGKEVARYPSSRPYNPESCNRLLGECPSRTAVDGNGDVWVANRAFNRQGSVTKIAHVACPDGNGDGQITTSRDLNGNGIIDRGNPAEFPGDADECLLFTVPVGGWNGVPRALALDAGGLEDIEGSAWVGLFNERKLVKLRNSDGAVVTEVELPHYRNDPALPRMEPYGSAIDSRGRVWAVTTPTYAPAQGLAYVDVATGTASEFFELPRDLTPPGRVVPITCGVGDPGGTYGIAIDEKDRVWVGGWTCEAAFRFDPDTKSWTVGQAPGAGLARGVAVERREGASSRVWVAFSSTPSRIAAFDAETLALLGSWALPLGSGAIGVGLDAAGKVWAIHQRSNNASRFDPDSGQVLSTTPVGVGPYTYSDFTGYARRHFTAPRGNYRRTFVPCENDSPAAFLRLGWDGATPVGTRLDLWIRVGNDLNTLAGAPRYGPWGQSADGTAAPVDLEAAGVPAARYALVEVALTSRTGNSTPELRSLDLAWGCKGPIVQ